MDGIGEARRRRRAFFVVGVMRERRSVVGKRCRFADSLRRRNSTGRRNGRPNRTVRGRLPCTDLPKSPGAGVIGPNTRFPSGGRRVSESCAFLGIYRVLTISIGPKRPAPPRSCVLSATRVSEPASRTRSGSELLFIPDAASVFSPSTGDGACPRGPSVVTGPGQGLIRFLLKTGGTT